ncbi:MAG TPA: hypothetical protein VF807_12605 [Ktedonobacterales bacterium]
MMSTRSAHYWLWFLLFGIASVIVGWSQTHTLTSEALWLLVTGVLGIILGTHLFGAGTARPYDLLIGLVFTGVGISGILHNLGYNLVAPSGPVTSGSSPSDALLGFSLSLPYALIHTVLGMTSLNHGLTKRAHTATASVA